METNQNASQPTLLFIPDISGFTAFVNETEFTHSQHIIEELLEVLIDANEIDLQVSEVEGDAILFYRNGPPPTAAELLAQVQRMFVHFHSYVKMYDSHRICQCGACSGATNLSLKFVVHYGETGINQIKNHSKLFGKDVIVAHRLLKNEVPHNEYVLLTHELVNACTSWVDIKQAAWDEPQEGSESYDLGQVDYCFISLKPLEARVPEPTIEDYGLKGKTKKFLYHESVIEAPLDQVFNVLSDLSIRHHWIDGIKGSDELNSKITRAGASHRCVIKNDPSDPFLISHSFQAGKDYVAFTETDQEGGIDTIFKLQKTGPDKTRIEMAYFLKANPVKELILKVLFKKKLHKGMIKSCEQLNGICQELKAEGRQHPAQIILHPAVKSASA